jgi:hypothetical protein
MGSWKHRLDSVCSHLGLKWYYEVTANMVVFRRSNEVEHDLAVCFGNPKFSITVETAMWITSSDMTDMLSEWLNHGL